MAAAHGHRIGLTDLLGPDLQRAACKGKAPAWDWAVHDDTPWKRVTRYTAAARICAGCPERAICTPGPDDDGVYGGRLFIKSVPVEPSACAWPGCGQLFITTDPTFEYCSPRCRHEASRVLKADRDRVRRAAA